MELIPTPRKSPKRGGGGNIYNLVGANKLKHKGVPWLPLFNVVHALLEEELLRHDIHLPPHDRRLIPKVWHGTGNLIMNLLINPTSIWRNKYLKLNGGKCRPRRQWRNKPQIIRPPAISLPLYRIKHLRNVWEISSFNDLSVGGGGNLTENL